jgi:hypothetical protein
MMTMLLPSQQPQAVQMPQLLLLLLLLRSVLSASWQLGKPCWQNNSSSSSRACS